MWPGRRTCLKLIGMEKINDKCAFSMMKMMLLMLMKRVRVVVSYNVYMCVCPMSLVSECVCVQTERQRCVVGGWRRR